jgi:tetratricopeptide (TPR) repeat protein
MVGFLFTMKDMTRLDNYDELFLSANQLADQGAYREAIELYKLAGEYKKDKSDLSLRLAIAYFNLEDYQNTINSLYFFIEQQPEALFAHQVLGRAFFKIKKFDDALIAFNKEIKLNPKYAEAYSDKAYALNELKRFQEAYQAAEIANQLDQSFPDPYDCMAIALNQMGQNSEALIFAFKALQIDNKNSDFYRTVGDIYLDIDENKKALKFYDLALKINPKFFMVLYNKSLALLKMLNFNEGWKLYEYRHTTHKTQNPELFQDFSKKKFQNAKNILILKEQGLGDFIMFSSILSDLSLDGKNIIVETDERILPLMKRSFKKIKFIKNINQLDKKLFDHVLSIASLGGYLRRDIQAFKKEINFFLKSEDNQKEKFKELFKKIKTNPKQKICGLSWRSDNKTIGNLKSIDLRELKPLLELSEFKFINLQYQISEQEKKEIKNMGMEIVNIPDIDLYNDIESLCSLIDACDFIVTISNINAHLAGALGKTTYLLSAKGKAKHFYWHHCQDSSLWYPTLKTFEQDNLDDWNTPINKIIETLNFKNDE